MKLIENNFVKKIIVPIKYIFSSGISFLIDQFLFNLILFFFKKNSFIIISKLIARAISSFINYLLNANVVFQNKNKNSILKYYGLVVVQAFVSSFLIYLIKIIFDEFNVGIISILVDVMIFVVNYYVQKKYIFN